MVAYLSTPLRTIISESHLYMPRCAGTQFYYHSKLRYRFLRVQRLDILQQCTIILFLLQFLCFVVYLLSSFPILVLRPVRPVVTFRRRQREISHLVTTFRECYESVTYLAHADRCFIVPSDRELDSTPRPLTHSR